jgi:actin-related protein 2
MTRGKTIVCDVGTGFVKLGFAGELTPAIIVPSVIGIVGHASPKSSEIAFGDDALKISESREIDLHYPIDAYDGFHDWSALAALLGYSFAKIDITDFSAHKIFFAKPQGMKRTDMITLYDVALMHFGFQAVGMRSSDSLVLFTQGLQSGIVVDLGESIFKVVPVHNGQAHYNMGSSMTVGGRYMSLHFMEMLKPTGHSELESADLMTDCSKTQPEQCHHLTDKFWMLLDKKGVKTGELVLRPELRGSRELGLAELVFETIQRAEQCFGINLCEKIVLSGGMSLLPGICAGLQSDLNSRFGTDLRNDMMESNQSLGFKVYASECRGVIAFEGAALLADLVSQEPNFWITKDEFLAKNKKKNVA